MTLWLSAIHDSIFRRRKLQPIVALSRHQDHAHLQQEGEKIYRKCTVYRKWASLELMLRWASFIRTQDKRSALSTIIYGVIRFRSAYTLFYTEFTVIKQIAIAQKIRNTLGRRLGLKKTQTRILSTC